MRSIVNPFYDVCIRAGYRSLTSVSEAEQAYMASPAFRSRIEFKGLTGLEDMIRGTRYMLQNVALDPRDAHDCLNSLKRGVVSLHFFGICNPIPSFELPTNTLEHAELVRAVEANISSSMFDAANRTRKWRSRVAQRAAGEDRAMDKYRAKAVWSTRADWAKNPGAARAHDAQVSEELNSNLARIREMRNQRMARLAQAACPRVTNWIDLLVDIAKTTLKAD